MSNMAILQEVDKCIRCNGCVISCKRTWKMKALNPGVLKISPDTRVIIKSQKRVDMGPFVRYSCWHCPAPACAGRCPFKAISKLASGAVAIDHAKCDPTKCNKQCVVDCLRGGYPRVGDGSDTYSPLLKAQKCTMCTPVAGHGAGPTGDLPTRATAAEIAICADRAHEPACVYTCPAKAMSYDTLAKITARIKDTSEGWMSFAGNGNIYWVSKQYVIAVPKADPLVEDHLSPMAGLLSGPFARAAIVPTLVVGGLLALSARRTKIESEELETSGEVG
jgi:Fe-S-cluster-containing dehydrogenase component